MQYIPFEHWVTIQPAPELHQDIPGLERPVSYSKRKAEPNTGKWFTVVEVGDEVPKYLGPGTPVMCNLTMVSDELRLGEERVMTIPFRSVAGARIGNRTMAELGTSYPVLPLGDYVLCVDNDEKHTLIIGKVDEERVARFFEGGPVPAPIPGKSVHASLQTLARGQRTDEQYETHVGEDGWEEQNPNRPNDGVKMMFSEVVSVGPEVPPGRLEPGDMVAFRPNICAIRFDLFGISYRLVRCSKTNSETMGKVPKGVFERMLGKAS